MPLDNLQQHLNKLKAIPTKGIDKPAETDSQYYNHYNTEGMTSINPLFGQPSNPNTANMGQLGTPSSRWKAQITKDTMSGLHDYNKQANDAQSVWASLYGPQVASQQGQQFVDTQAGLGDIMQGQVSRRGDNSLNNPSYVLPGELIGAAVAPPAMVGLGAGWQAAKNAPAFAAQYANFPGSASLRFGGPRPNPLRVGLSKFKPTARSVFSPRGMARGTAGISLISDTATRIEDIMAAKSHFNTQMEEWNALTPEVQEQYRDYMPDQDKIWAQVQNSRGNQVLDQYEQAGGLGKLLQASGLVLAPHQWSAMAGAPNAAMQDALSETGRMAEGLPGMVAAQLYGGPQGANIPESHRYDWANSTPEARNAAMQLESFNSSMKNMDRGSNWWSRNVINPVGKMFLSAPEGANDQLLQFLRGAVAQGDMSPEQLDTIVDRTGLSFNEADSAKEFYDTNQVDKPGYTARRDEVAEQSSQNAALQRKQESEAQALRNQVATTAGSNSLGLSTPMGTGRPSVQQ
jgi:hypothetical protein